MISTYVMQEIFSYPNHYVGFEIDVRGGTVRMLELTMRKHGHAITVNDIVATLGYMLRRGWLRESGVYLGRQLYSVAK